MNYDVVIIDHKVKLQYHDCSELKKKSFHIPCPYCAEVADNAVCTPDVAVLPSVLSGPPHWFPESH